jgi:hypothetical protein
MRKSRNRATLMHTLIEELEEAAAILAGSDFDTWARWFGGDAKRLRAGDREALKHILQAYGGMGSFTDVVLGGPDGERLDELRSSIYTLAKALR